MSEPTTATTATTAPALLRLENLQVRYGSSKAAAVDDVCMEVWPRELVAVVGESGSGKTTLIRSTLGLLPSGGRVTGGRIFLGGSDVTRWRDKQLARIRGPFVGFIPQDPGTALNPVKRIGQQVVEAILLNDRRIKGPVARSMALEKLETAGLRDVDRIFGRYAHELSGGMKQRALIAIALASNPKLLIADEPTSSLDVTIQKTILDHLDRLRADFNLGVVLVTHDLGVAAERSDRMIVMQRGRVVETGPTNDVVAAPEHRYTRELISAAPSSHSSRLVSRVQPDGHAPRQSVQPGPASRTDLLVVDSVSKHFRVSRGPSGSFAAVSAASFTIPEGTTHAIVGESGAGKSTIVRLAVGLTPADDGSVWFDGSETTKLTHELRREFRRHVQFVYQNPFSSLDPKFTVRRLLAEPLHVHRAVASREVLRERVHELLAAVALDDSFADRLPVELSGGQAQRVAIARALALNPRLLVLDEAVSALDVSVQAQVLQLLVDLQAQHGLTYLFVTHDLGVVRMIADTVSVMRSGKFVEQGPVERVFSAPQDPYTRMLIDAIPGRAMRVAGPAENRISASIGAEQ